MGWEGLVHGISTAGGREFWSVLPTAGVMGWEGLVHGISTAGRGGAESFGQCPPTAAGEEGGDTQVISINITTSVWMLQQNISTARKLSHMVFQ